MYNMCIILEEKVQKGGVMSLGCFPCHGWVHVRKATPIHCQHVPGDMLL